MSGPSAGTRAAARDGVGLCPGWKLRQGAGAGRRSREP